MVGTFNSWFEFDKNTFESFIFCLRYFPERIKIGGRIAQVVPILKKYEKEMFNYSRPVFISIFTTLIIKGVLKNRSFSIYGIFRKAQLV